MRYQLSKLPVTILALLVIPTVGILGFSQVQPLQLPLRDSIKQRVEVEVGPTVMVGSSRTTVLFKQLTPVISYHV